MTHLIKDPSVVILTETTSNVSNDKFINNIDQLIFPLTDVDFEAMKPEILLTFGGMVISKKIKQLLRKHPPEHHWHVDAQRSLDTYHSMTRHFEISPQLFFSQFFFLTEAVTSSFQDKWLFLKEVRKTKHNSFVQNLSFSDLKVFDLVLKSLPGSINVQIANSSIIRYAQLFDLDPTIKVFCNRGASGIDGSTSTALGAAFQNSEQTVFITGDISFFYDSNGLWNNYIPADFRIIVVNNGGGGIFKFIPGPKASGALDYFETSHNLNASALCEMFGFEYFDAKDALQLESHLTKFYTASNKPALLEIFTSSDVNDSILSDYFNNLK
jgi:2-succinyl-5-enolpyruvyl-6-hydroxy-3-cyclohexene-1-carboxylate synthase